MYCTASFSPSFPVYYTDDERVYGYVRFETGDEMSRRAKFAFITWIGPNVGALKKAKVSTDKAFMKEVMRVSRTAADGSFPTTTQGRSVQSTHAHASQLL